MAQRKEAESVAARLAAVQAALQVPKAHRNNFAKYDYRNAEDILKAAKPLLHENGLTLTISDDLVNLGDRYYVRATATLYATDSDDTITVTAFAREEIDRKGMDASQITGSTSSYARKYALNGLFCLDDSQDADTDAYQKQRQKAPKVNRTTGEIVEMPRQSATQRPQEARSEPKPVEPTADTPTWQQASTALHAEAGKHDIDHAHVKAWLIQASIKAGNPITSTKDASAQTLTFVRTQKLAKDPEKFRQQAEDALDNPDIWALCYPDQSPIEDVFPKKPEVEVIEDDELSPIEPF